MKAFAFLHSRAGRIRVSAIRRKTVGYSASERAYQAKELST